MSTAPTGEKRCLTCGLTFSSEDELAHHRREANHPELPMEDKIECDRCGFIMESEEELRKHMQQNHAPGARTS